MLGRTYAYRDRPLRKKKNGCFAPCGGGALKFFPPHHICFFCEIFLISVLVVAARGRFYTQV